MQFSLTRDQKMQTLVSIRDQLELELYRELLYQEIDPDTFELENYSTPEDPVKATAHFRINELVNKSIEINKKIQEL